MLISLLLYRILIRLQINADSEINADLQTRSSWTKLQ